MIALAHNAPACPFVLRKEDTTTQYQIITKSQVDFSVYPNPNDGNFILYLKNNTETKQPYFLEIYNSLGIPILKIKGVMSEMESKQITERIVLSQGVYYAILRSTGSNSPRSARYATVLLESDSVCNQLADLQNQHIPK